MLFDLPFINHEIETINKTIDPNKTKIWTRLAKNYPGQSVSLDALSKDIRQYRKRKSRSIIRCRNIS